VTASVSAMSKPHVFRQRRPPHRGLGIATATTSAAFQPHLEQRVRSARSLSVTFQPTQARESIS
jgi:hypothetical protein